ncbi:hypothetical protein YC2023_014523 [Brassica napus]
MARLSLRPNNRLFSTPLQTHNHPFLSLSLYTITPPSFPHLKSRVKCSASGTERVRESKKIPNNLIKEDLPKLPNPGSDSEALGTEQNWPPWKNIPERYKLIGATSLAFVICNMDKVNLSIAIIPMSHQFGWSSSVAGLVQSSFFWGYALSQLPGGWLSKIFGGRKVLEIGVFTWSFATALVPLLAGFMPGLIFSRILVGIGEGVSPSAATDLIARTIPVGERSRAVGFVFGGLSLGSVLGLLLAPPIIQTFNWESVFYLFGLLGIGWFIGFQFLGEEEVSHRGDETTTSHKPENTTREELGNSLKVNCGFITHLLLSIILMKKVILIIFLVCSEALSLNLRDAAWVSILPPLASIFVTSLASQFADYLISNGVETTTVRKICQTIAFVAPAICMTLSSVDIGLPPWEIAGILTAGLALSSFALSGNMRYFSLIFIIFQVTSCFFFTGLYCTHQDISPEYASILLGITNTVGAVPGIVGVALTGFLLDSTHSWTMSLFAPSIFFYLTGTVVWLAFASSKPQKFSKDHDS